MHLRTGLEEIWNRKGLKTTEADAKPLAAKVLVILCGWQPGIACSHSSLTSLMFGVFLIRVQTPKSDDELRIIFAFIFLIVMF